MDKEKLTCQLIRRDIVNWCVYYSTDFVSAFNADTRIAQYSYNHLKDMWKEEGKVVNYKYAIIVPDVPTEAAARWAIKHNKALTEKFRKIVKIFVSHELPYPLTVFGPEDKGCKYYVDLMMKEEPWKNSDERGMECFTIRPEYQLAKVTAYNSYTKHNETLILSVRSHEDYDSYTFKEINGQLKIYFTDSDYQSALKHALDELKYGTCLTLISVTKYF